MNILEAIILGLVQGLTEFIPVSSSGHLIILHEMLGAGNGGLTFDVALHLGTLLALVLFFYKDIGRLATALFRKAEETRLAWLLALATVPAVIVGVLLEDLAASSFRSIRLVAVNLILVGVLMIAAERYGQRRARTTSLQAVSRNQALAMGLAQAAALIPGVSRSGSTITAGLFGGMGREAAARFSFLLAIPITFGAVFKVLLEPDALASVSQETDIFAAGMVTAFLSGLFAIGFLLRFVAKHRLDVFAYYRFGLGGLVLLLSFL